jgi:phosphoserine phosphatase
MLAGGWDVRVITASPRWLVEPMAERYGIAPERVVGMQRVLRDGRITVEIDSPISWGDGKQDALRLFVGRDRLPSFVAGDSIGDWKLLEWATECALVIEPSPEPLIEFANWRRSLGETWLVQAFPEPRLPS